MGSDLHLVTEVAEFEGGKLYKKNALHVVVLNGTYYEMGRQYGHLLKDLIHWHLGELENEFLVQTAGNNPVDRPAPLLSHEELKRKFMPGYYRAQPHNLKRMLQGAAETSGLTLEQMVFMDHMLQAVLLSAGVSGCTSAAVWGDASKDGRLYTGRNHDFGKAWRDRLPADSERTCITTYPHMEGGHQSVGSTRAGLGRLSTSGALCELGYLEIRRGRLSTPLSVWKADRNA